MSKDGARLHVPLALVVVVIGAAAALATSACDDNVACGNECNPGADDAGACVPDDAGMELVDGGDAGDDRDCESHGGAAAG